MWAYATLAVKDDPLFERLLEASIVRIEDHDTQNLANSCWAAAAELRNRLFFSPCWRLSRLRTADPEAIASIEYIDYIDDSLFEFSSI